MYSNIETGGKQVRVEVGQKIFVERLNVEENQEYTFDKVLLLADDKVKVGNPYVKGSTVVAKVVKNGLNRKIRIYKYKAKANYRRTIGHRQPYTCLVIEKINA